MKVLLLCACLLAVALADTPAPSNEQKAADESKELATKNRKKANAIVTQNAEGIPDAPCPAGSVKNCDDDEHPRYSPVKGKAAVMVAKTGKLYAVYNAANNSALKSVPELAAEEDPKSGEDDEKRNKKKADQIVAQNINGWADKGPFVLSKAVPQSPLHSDDPKDKACTHPNKKMLRQPHMTIRHGDYPTDNTDCAEGCRKIKRDDLKALVAKHLPLYGGYFIDLCVSKESKYTWKL
jgi:hypothetical protein